jgi:hypothetical protein
MILFFPVAVFTFYQWTLRDSWASTLLSVLFFLGIIGALVYPLVSLTKRARREGAESLHADAEHLIAHGPLHASYRIPRWYAFMPVLAALFLRSLVIAVAAKNAMVQVILIVVVEIMLFISFCVLKPHPTRKNDIFQGYLALSKAVATGLLIAFVPSLSVKPIPRVVIGIIIALIYSVAIVVTFINIVLHLGIFSIFRRTPPRSRSEAQLVGEKDVMSPTSATRSPMSMDSSLSPFVDTPSTITSFGDVESSGHGHSRAPSDSFSTSTLSRPHRTAA